MRVYFFAYVVLATSLCPLFLEAQETPSSISGSNASEAREIPKHSFDKKLENGETLDSSSIELPAYPELETELDTERDVESGMYTGPNLISVQTNRLRGIEERLADVEKRLEKLEAAR